MEAPVTNIYTGMIVGFIASRAEGGFAVERVIFVDEFADVLITNEGHMVVEPCGTAGTIREAEEVLRQALERDRLIGF